jgi:chorismate mutase / prephenate dehydratase
LSATFLKKRNRFQSEAANSQSSRFFFLGDAMSLVLSDCRAAIDVVDRQLLQLLNIRAKLACELARVKRETGVDIVDAEREQQVLALVCKNNAGPFDRDAITRIFESIILEARRVQAGGPAA